MISLNEFTKSLISQIVFIPRSMFSIVFELSDKMNFTPFIPISDSMSRVLEMASALLYKKEFLFLHQEIKYRFVS